MTVAYVVAGVVQRYEADYPGSAEVITGPDVGVTVSHFPQASAAVKLSCGYYPVVDVPRPPDTATDTSDQNIVVGASDVTRGWTVRPKTAEEIAEADRQTEANSDRQALLDNGRLRMQTVLDYLSFVDPQPGGGGTVTPSTANPNRDERIDNLLLNQKRIARALMQVIRAQRMGG